MSNPTERVKPNDRRLPPNLLLSEPVDAEILPDGRAVPVNLPPGARAFLYPDLPVAPGVVVPTFDAPAEAPAEILLTSEAPASDEAPVVEESAPPSPAASDELEPEPTPSPADEQETPAPASEE